MFILWIHTNQEHIKQSIQDHQESDEFSEEREGEHDGSDEEHEETSGLDVIEKAEVPGDESGDLFEMSLVATQQTAEQHCVQRQHARGRVRRRQQAQQRGQQHPQAQQHVHHSRVEDQFRDIFI